MLIFLMNMMFWMNSFTWLLIQFKNKILKTLVCWSVLKNIFERKMIFYKHVNWLDIGIYMYIGHLYVCITLVQYFVRYVY